MMSEHDFEELSMWQDILDEVMAGRVDNHKCPFCEKKTVEADLDAEGGAVRVSCLSCGKFVEGRGVMPF